MKFAVTIRATVTKTLEIEANSEQEAIEEGHSLFTVSSEEGQDENYDEDLVSCVELEEDEQDDDRADQCEEDAKVKASDFIMQNQPPE